MIDIGMLVGFNVESSAEWRRRKADEFPGDASRNNRAAEMLDRIAADLTALEGSELHRRLFEVSERDSERFSTEVSELTRQVGYHAFPDAGAQFVEELLSRLDQ